jgi:hypothetical protein
VYDPQDCHLWDHNPKNDDIAPDWDRTDVRPEFGSRLGAFWQTLQQANSSKCDCTKALCGTWIVGRNAGNHLIEVSPRLPTEDNFRHLSSGAR